MAAPTEHARWVAIISSRIDDPRGNAAAAVPEYHLGTISRDRTHPGTPISSLDPDTGPWDRLVQLRAVAAVELWRVREPPPEPILSSDRSKSCGKPLLRFSSAAPNRDVSAPTASGSRSRQDLEKVVAPIQTLGTLTPIPPTLRSESLSCVPVPRTRMPTVGPKGVQGWLRTLMVLGSSAPTGCWRSWSSLPSALSERASMSWPRL